MRAEDAALKVPDEPHSTRLSEADRAESDLIAAMEDDASQSRALSALTLGALVRTGGGDVPIEALKPGDAIETLDEDAARILDIQVVPPPDEPPVILPIGALNATREAAFGPERRIFFRGGAADLLFGAGEVLIEAGDLPASSGARRGEWESCGSAYVLTVDRPALIWIDGVVMESAPSPAYAAARPLLKPMEAAALFSLAARR